MLLLSPLLTLVCLVTTPITIIVSRLIIRAAQKFFIIQQKDLGALNGFIEEMVSGQKVVRLFSREKITQDNFERINAALVSDACKAQAASGVNGPCNNMINNFAYVLVAALGGVCIIRRIGGITVGAVFSFLLYMRHFTMPINNILNLVNMLQLALASAERVFAVLDEDEERDRDDAVPAALIRTGIKDPLAQGSGGSGGGSGLSSRFFDGATAVLGGALLLSALPPVLLYPADFFLAGESFFSTDFLFTCVGYAAGFMVVFFAAFSVFKTALHAPFVQLGVFFSMTLAVIVLKQVTEIIRLLIARRIIPMNRQLFRVITAAVNNEIVFLFALIAVTALMLVCISAAIAATRAADRAASREKEAATGNPAEKRKRKAALRNQRRWRVSAAAFLVAALLSLTVLKTISEKAAELSPAEPMTISGSEIVIPATQVDDGHLHRFAFNAEGGTEVRFIVVKKSQAAYGVGLDACDICGATGYYERKDGIVCRLCDVVMNKSTIGFKGGCNPVPLAYTMRGGNMVIKTGDLETEKKRFQ
jgi:uncharacterized membrane protein